LVLESRLTPAGLAPKPTTEMRACVRGIPILWINDSAFMVIVEPKSRNNLLAVLLPHWQK